MVYLALGAECLNYLSLVSRSGRLMVSDLAELVLERLMKYGGPYQKNWSKLGILTSNSHPKKLFIYIKNAVNC